MNRKHTGITLAPKKHTVKKVLWGLAFLALIAWCVQHPYQARHAANQVVYALTVLFSQGGGH
ncbi:MAG TPA: hypothetical protein VJ870_18505 [Amycolatopsis sp.]|nr:hypothetical protein [Amycolatopsis sp.]